MDDEEKVQILVPYGEGETSVHMSIEHVKVYECKEGTNSRRSFSKILNHGDEYILCSKDPIFLRKNGDDYSKEKLQFLKNHNVLAFDSSLIWSYKDNFIFAFDHDGIVIMREIMHLEGLDINAATCLGQTLYISTTTGLHVYNLKTNEREFLRGDFAGIRKSNYNDVLIYGDGKVFISPTEATERTGKISFMYGEALEIEWLDSYIAILTPRQINILNHTGKVLRTHVVGGRDHDMIAMATGNTWLAAMTVMNKIMIFDSQMNMIYCLRYSAENRVHFRAGEHTVCIMQEGNTSVVLTDPDLPQYSWFEELDAWATGKRHSLHNCTCVGVDVIKQALIEKLPTWITYSPSIQSCDDLRNFCKESIEVTQAFIRVTTLYVKQNFHNGKREFWKQFFTIIKIVLNGGLPEPIRKCLAEKRHVVSVAECSYIFGVELFAREPSLVTWVIVNLRVTLFREILYQFIESEKCGDMVTDILVASAASTDEPLQDMNPFELLSVDSAVRSCKRGNIDKWLKLLEIHKQDDVTTKMQHVFDNVSEQVVFGGSLNTMVKCLLLCGKAYGKNTFSMAPTIRLTMLKTMSDHMATDYEEIEPQNISRCLQFIDFDILKTEAHGFANKRILHVTTNDCGIYIATEEGVYCVAYVGLEHSLKIVSTLHAVAMASTINKLCISGVSKGVNVLYVYDTTADIALYRWKTASVVTSVAFIDNILFTVEENESVIVYNHLTGRMEDVLRIRQEAEDDSREELERRIAEITGTDPAPAPPLTNSDGYRSDASYQSDVDGVPVVPLPQPQPLPQPLPQPHPPVPSVTDTKIYRFGNYIVENASGCCVVWKKRGITFSFTQQNSYGKIVLMIPNVDNDLFYDLVIRIERNSGTIETNARDRVFKPPRRERITAVQVFGKSFLILGTASGTIILFNLLRMMEVYVMAIPNATISDIFIDGVMLYVSTKDNGVFVVSLSPWKQERHLNTLTKIAENNEAWRKEITRFPHDFDNTLPSLALVKFVEVCTRDRIPEAFRHERIVDAFLQHSKKSKILVRMCIERFMQSSREESRFSCAICQSSTVDLENPLDVIKTCLHRFHHTCLQNLMNSQPRLNDFTMRNWALATNLKCPICRTQFTAGDVAPDLISTNLCIYRSDDD